MDFILGMTERHVQRDLSSRVMKSDLCFENSTLACMGPVGIKEEREGDQGGAPAVQTEEQRLEGEGKCAEASAPLTVLIGARCAHTGLSLRAGLVPLSGISGPKDGWVLHFDGYHYTVSLFTLVSFPGW